METILSISLEVCLMVWMMSIVTSVKLATYLNNYYFTDVMCTLLRELLKTTYALLAMTRSKMANWLGKYLS